MTNTPTPTIRWPVEFEPARCAVHVRNELTMPVSADRVWAWLIRAALWPQWYPNAKRVHFLDGPPPDLALGTRFRWWTFGVTIKSYVREFVPAERIAWDGRGRGLYVYHAWLVRETATGCHVLTEETQQGWLAHLGYRLMPTRMSRFHQLWLERLRDQAMRGLPPTP